jgi:hypothetical protein
MAWRDRAADARSCRGPDHSLIRTWFADALVAGFDPERAIGVTDPKDRHVASAAAAIAPYVLVTNHLNDFDFAALAALASRSGRRTTCS